MNGDENGDLLLAVGVIVAVWAIFSVRGWNGWDADAWGPRGGRALVGRWNVRVVSGAIGASLMLAGVRPHIGLSAPALTLAVAWMTAATAVLVGGRPLWAAKPRTVHLERNVATWADVLPWGRAYLVLWLVSAAFDCVTALVLFLAPGW